MAHLTTPSPMFRFLLFAALLASPAYGQTGTCDPAQTTGPAIGACPNGQVEDSAGNCCPPSGLLTTPLVTTAAPSTVVTVAGGGSTVIAVTNTVASSVTLASTNCVDLLNPLTGVSDCPARASLCNDATYFTVMTQQCPRTCGRCSNTTSTGTCVDLLNPLTGVSDCPARASLCNDATYYTVMTQQCPRTCGRCNGTSSSTVSSSINGTCVDLLNPTTGVSDCPTRAALCTNTAYLALMRIQCPRTCGFCTSTASTVAGVTVTAATTSAGTCADRINPTTGTSDCPGAAYLCNNAAYATLMAAQCPLTCGRCSG